MNEAILFDATKQAFYRATHPNPLYAIDEAWRKYLAAYLTEEKINAITTDEILNQFLLTDTVDIDLLECVNIKTCEETDPKKFRVLPSGNTASTCKKCYNNKSIFIATQNKIKAVYYKGGKCEQCGFTHECLDTFDFHHIDQITKLSKSRESMNFGWSWSRIQLEIDKCILVCANCHKIIHEGKSNRGQSGNDNRVKNNKIKAIHYKGGRCSQCNLESPHYSIYEFHHIDPSTKNHELSKLTSYKWEIIKEELDKCAILCTNCHRIEEHQRRENGQ